MNRKKTYNRMIALVAALATVLVMLLSSLYLEEHMTHECTGEDCHVCTVMHMCSNLLKTVGNALLVSCTIPFLFFCVQKRADEVRTAIFCNSLVSFKVRLDN